MLSPCSNNGVGQQHDITPHGPWVTLVSTHGYLFLDMVVGCCEQPAAFCVLISLAAGYMIIEHQQPGAWHDTQIHSID